MFSDAHTVLFVLATIVCFSKCELADSHFPSCRLQERPVSAAAICQTRTGVVTKALLEIGLSVFYGQLAVVAIMK